MADVSPNSAEKAKLIKIGDVARHFRISVDLLRLYEREGLLIPVRSPGNTRYYTEKDYVWIGTILRLVRQARLNFAGIRHLLALLPCWKMKDCAQTKQTCAYVRDATAPCWMNRHCCDKASTRVCYDCEVYRSAPNCENLKALLVNVN
jgi:MerR family transcriptional regulator/heat shock protein HspR